MDSTGDFEGKMKNMKKNAKNIEKGIDKGEKREYNMETAGKRCVGDCGGRKKFKKL